LACSCSAGSWSNRELRCKEKASVYYLINYNYFFSQLLKILPLYLKERGETLYFFSTAFLSSTLVHLKLLQLCHARWAQTVLPSWPPQ
jgi:hypothetical protein